MRPYFRHIKDAIYQEISNFEKALVFAEVFEGYDGGFES